MLFRSPWADNRDCSVSGAVALHCSVRKMLLPEDDVAAGNEPGPAASQRLGSDGMHTP